MIRDVVTIKQVAKSAGVSVSTVSKVMNGVPTVNKIIARQVRETVSSLGYQPNANARALSSKSSRILGVLVYSIADPISAQVVLGIEQRSKELGYDVLLMHDQGTDEDELHLSRVLIGKRIDAVAIVGAHTQLTNDRMISLFENQLPVVLVFREAESPDIPAIHLDDFGGARLATEHLLQHGHRKIGLITGCEEVRRLDRFRKAGFLDAHRAADVPVDENLFETGNWDPASGYAAMKKILQRAQPSAIFVFNDRMAYGAMHAVREAGLRIPADVAIVGFDNLASLAEFSSPPLTSIDVDWSGIGAHTADCLVRSINGEKCDTGTPIPTRLVIRKSCGCTEHKL